ncbi:hypothetical protein B0T24DRAFT_643594 [Lasiosphaeria ovina]|uniref:Uncharacterized protein n=1 Tax=Lasiosphaeria ovina TaxID=92902 RepID=A0AAE0JSA9_9PEZI|nr:hypothetical protein B0T24DRAFT_643594 [Lasiosphaeria ovina]
MPILLLLLVLVLVVVVVMLLLLKMEGWHSSLCGSLLAGPVGAEGEEGVCDGERLVVEPERVGVAEPLRIGKRRLGNWAGMVAGGCG